MYNGILSNERPLKCCSNPHGELFGLCEGKTAREHASNNRKNMEASGQRKKPSN
jgi:hypothetical protein